MGSSPDSGGPASLGGLFTNLGEREAMCPAHGAYRSKGMRPNLTNGPGREIWTGCQACDADRKAQEAAEAKAVHQAREAKRLEEAIGSAGIPLRFRQRTFDAFVAATDPQRRALAIARKFADELPNDRRGAGLIFAGLPGTGKSHLAAAVMLRHAGRMSMQYVTCMGLIRAVRDTWRKDGDRSEREVIRMLGDEVRLLVIDEVGVQNGSDNEQNIIFEVLDKRYSGMLPTILLTNQDKDGFKSFVGERVFDRLIETSRWVAFDWASYRATARGAA
jgi:DNA replication protein DnaC